MLRTLAAIVALGSACTKNSPEPAAAQTATAPAAAAAGGAGEQAKPQADGEDTTPPPGIDLSQLDPFERKVFFRIVNHEPSACGKAHSLLQSVKTDPGCRKSFYAVRYVAKLVDSGYTDSEVAEHLQKRFRAPRKTIDTGDAPVKGNPSARLAIVEFVDFECPHCKRVQPVMRQVLDEFKSDVKVYFKNYPLSSHTYARLAAQGAVAAGKQGKFWPFADKVWEKAESLSPAVLEQIAKDVGLDVDRWRKDLDSDDVKAKVQKDHDEGSQLGLVATPTIYMNGREYSDARDIDSMRDWINEELGR